jgi:hypothetical protein
MTWTTEYPTKPGYYWIRNQRISGLSASIRQSYAGVRIVEVSDTLDYVLWTKDEAVHRKQIVSAEWQGPIEPESE